MTTHVSGTATRPRTWRGAAAVLLVLILGVLTACGADEPSTKAAKSTPEKDLRAGTCWDDQQLPDALGRATFEDWQEKYAGGDAGLADSLRDDAAFTTQIDCAQPHSLELYNVVELAPAVMARVKDYADLLDQGSALFGQISDQVNERCLAGSPYDVPPRAARGLDVQLSPFLNTEGGLHVAWDPFPADLWEKGQHKFVCTLQQEEPGTLRFADLTTAKVPLTARVCLNTPGTYVPCRGKHQAENIAELVVNSAVQKGQLRGRQAVKAGPKGPYVALSDATFARLDKVCQTFLSSVSTTKRAKSGVQARAYLGSAEQWPTKEGKYVASCFALKPFEPPPPTTGSVFNRG